MNAVGDKLKSGLIRSLRWSERYTKTDMVYLARAGFWTNLNVIVSSVLALLLSVAFANLLPKEVYGTYQYLLSLSALIVALCLGGMSQSVTQSVARGNEGDVRVALRTLLKWSLIPTAIGLVGALYYFLHANYIVAAGLAIIAILAPLSNSFGIYAALLSGKRDFKKFFVYSTITNSVYYASMFLAMFYFKDAVVLIFVNLAVNAAVTAYLYIRTLKVYTPNTNTDPGTVAYGAHLSAMNAFGTVISQLDSVLVFHFLGPLQLAVYSFATQIPERAGGLFGFIGGAAFPKFSQRTLDEIKKHILPQTLRAALMGAGGAILYVVFAPLLFHLLFPKYLDALLYTQVYGLVIILMSANLASSALVAQRLKKELYLTSFINPVMLITLQIPLLLLYGIWGMLAARLVSDLIGILLSLLLLYRARGADI